MWKTSGRVGQGGNPHTLPGPCDCDENPFLEGGTLPWCAYPRDDVKEGLPEGDWGVILLLPKNSTPCCTFMARRRASVSGTWLYEFEEKIVTSKV